MTIYNVYNAAKIVDKNGRVHLPRKFLDRLKISPNDQVNLNVAWDSEIRIRKDPWQVGPDRCFTLKVDDVGKLLIPQTVRRKYGLRAKSRVWVSYFEGMGEIRVKKRK